METFKISFILKKGKPNRQGEVPIFCRLTLSGQRIELFTQRYINPIFWNVAKQASINTFDGVNTRLEILKFQIFEAQNTLIKDNQLVTAQSIQDFIKNKENKKKEIETKRKNVKLVDYYKQHNDLLFKEIGHGVAKGTHERHTTCLKILIDFLISIENINIDIQDVTPKLIKDFNYYLRVERNNSNNTAAKYCKNLGKIINQAFDNDLIENDVMSRVKLKLEPVNKPFLTQSEINKIIKKDFNITRLEQVRDLFVFMIYTGLAYSDCKNLKMNMITDNIIKINRQKTNIESVIPLLPQALKILKKYDNKLPLLSNQKMNSYLKEIGDLCGLEKTITCHTARHTFATTITLANGVSISSVSKMLGHTNLDMTLHYAKIINSTIINEMDVLSKKIG